MVLPTRIWRTRERNQRRFRCLSSPNPCSATGKTSGLRFACEQSDAGTEGLQSAVWGHLPFWENKHMIAAVHGLAGMGEAAPESGGARQREDIEERGDEQIFKGSQKVQQPVALVARVPPILQHLTGHGNGNPAAHGSGQRVENQRGVERGNVVCDQQERLLRKAKLAFAR